MAKRKTIKGLEEERDEFRRIAEAAQAKNQNLQDLFRELVGYDELKDELLDEMRDEVSTAVDDAVNNLSIST